MIVADRYARALMELAAEKGKLDNARTDMKEIMRVVEENRDLRLFLQSPVIKADKKEKVLAQIFGDKLTPITFEFVRMLARKNREGILYEIAAAFDEQYKRNKNILTAVVTTANGLDKTTRKKMLELVESHAKGEVELIEKVDPATIGGFVLRIGDKQIDRSVARQLTRLKKELINN